MDRFAGTGDIPDEWTSHVGRRRMIRWVSPPCWPVVGFKRKDPQPLAETTGDYRDS